MVEELMSTEYHSLLVPTANNLADVEPFIDAYRLNPKATDADTLQKIIFLGYLLGWALKWNSSLGLYLPRAFWSRVCYGDEKYVYSLDDLRSMDLFRYNHLQQLKKDIHTLGHDELKANYETLTFEADLDSEQRVELVPGGANIQINKSNIDDYIAKYLEAYSRLDSLQFRYVMQGILHVCGTPVVQFLTPEVANSRACGPAKIVFDQFKSSVEVSSKENQCDYIEDDVYAEFKVKHDITQEWFWQIVESMSDKDRQRLLKFWTGRTRLVHDSPLEFRIIQENQKDSLPVSNTCA